MQIEPTTRCNFTRGFCAGRSMRQGDLAWEAFTAFLSAHPDLRHIELQGEGEPLLHPLFYEMVADRGAGGAGGAARRHRRDPRGARPAGTDRGVG